MNRQLVLVSYGLLFIVSIIQIAGGAQMINLGNQLTTSQNSNIYSAMYSTQAGFYIATGVITIILVVLLLVALLMFPTITYIKRLGEFMCVLVVLCFQASISVYSAINASVLSDQSGQFSIFPDSKCDFSSLKSLLTWISVLNWLLVCPMLIVLLNSFFGEWKQALDKESEAELTEPSAQDALNN